MKPLVTGAIGGGALTVIAVVLLLTFHGSTHQYSLNVDARTETGDGMSESHLIIQNSGSAVLTNIKADYGGKVDNIPVLNPGEKVMLSPPTTSKNVTVTTDQGVTVTKSFSQFVE